MYSCGTGSDPESLVQKSTCYDHTQSSQFKDEENSLRHSIIIDQYSNDIIIIEMVA